ncbi:hypothetical protein ACWEO4_20700 [Streptomyces sp. NPDC004393]|uniref:hypothetical protein n=1 Tax=Streptomyces sp. NPDC004533 TaxID=3154278 RepID=UPI0033B9E16C
MKPPNVKPHLSEWRWQSLAACRGMDSSVFFSPMGEREAVGAIVKSEPSRSAAPARCCGLTESERRTGAPGW